MIVMRKMHEAVELFFYISLFFLELSVFLGLQGVSGRKRARSHVGSGVQ